jgi:hypothetical protein
MPENDDELYQEAFGEVSPEAYKEICDKFEAQTAVLGEAFMLIYKAGLMSELSPQTRDYIAASPWVQEMIKSGEGPSLELRLSPKEYIQHLARILDVPGHQLDFLTFIVKTCYLIQLAEKNPMVAQELRGVQTLTNAIDDLMRS